MGCMRSLDLGRSDQEDPNTISHRTGRVRCLRQDIDNAMRVPCASEILNAKVIAFILHYKMTRKREIRKLTYGGGSLDDSLGLCVGL